LVPWASLVVQVPEVRAAAETRETQGVALATWLRQHACHVGLVDVGFLPYAGQFRVLDLAGITDDAVAALPGGHVAKSLLPVVMARAPDTLLLRGHEVRESPLARSAAVGWHSTTERALAEASEVRALYGVAHVAQYAPGYVYYVLQRTSAQRCPKR